jgi:hypothetical protein
LFVPAILLAVALSGCGILDKLKGNKDAGLDADVPAADAAVAVETPDAAAADAGPRRRSRARSRSSGHASPMTSPTARTSARS